MFSVAMSAQNTTYCENGKFKLLASSDKNGLIIYTKSTDKTHVMTDTVFYRLTGVNKIQALVCNDSIISFIYRNDCCDTWYTYQYMTDVKKSDEYLSRRKDYDNSIMMEKVVSKTGMNNAFYDIIKRNNWKMISLQFLESTADQKTLTISSVSPPARQRVVLENRLLDPFTLKQKLQVTDSTGVETVWNEYQVDLNTLGNKLIRQYKAE